MTFGDRWRGAAKRVALGRRGFLAAGGAGGWLLALSGRARAARPGGAGAAHGVFRHDGMGTVGEVDHAFNRFDPHDILTEFETGVVSRLPDGRVLREFSVTAVDREIEIAPGVHSPTWTYDGRVSGPTLRATAGDIVRIRFTNAGSLPHTTHGRGIRSAHADGVPRASRDRATRLRGMG